MAAGAETRFEDALGVIASDVDDDRDWTESEPGFRELIDEVRRLLRRGRKRWWIAAALTIVIVAGVVARQARNVRRYPARIMLGVTENATSEESPVHSSAELKNYVYYAVFTDSALMKIIEKNHYDDKMLAKQPRLVLEEFRETVEVDVAKNEFATARLTGETRSALVSVELWLPDPEQAIDITRQLGDLVIQRDEENQLERIRLERTLAVTGVSIVRNEIDRMERELAAANYEIEDASPMRRAELSVTIDNVTRAMLGAKTRLESALERRRKFDHVGADSNTSVALRWDRVDWGAAALRINERASLAQVGFGSLFILFPLLLLGVGAFNRRVYDDRDVARLGYDALGVVQTRRRHG